MLAEYGEQLFDAAEAGKCDLHFEAAVAGAIPIIRPLRQSLVASELTEVMGIVNGTTNYITIPLQCNPRGAFLSYRKEVSYTIKKQGTGIDCLFPYSKLRVRSLGIFLL